MATVGGVQPLTAPEIRASFANCSQGEARRATLPDLDQVPWDALDYLGWRDPSGSPRAYLVVPRDNAPVGLMARQTTSDGRTARRSTMCQVCLTPHSGSGVTLTVARKAGAAGKRGDSTGIYLCRDLACSLYVRGARSSGVPRLRETLPVEQLVARLRTNLDEFVTRVLG